MDGASTTLYSCAQWVVKLGKEKEFIQVWEASTRWTIQYQKGAIYGRLLQDLTDPKRFLTWGPWEDKESLRAWRESAEFKKAFQKFNDLCTMIEPETLRSITAIGSGMVQEIIQEQDLSCL